MAIRVVVASEVRLYREGLRRVLQDTDGISLVGVASSAGEVVEQACRLVPSVVVVDMAMTESFSVARHFARTPNIGGIVILGIPELEPDVIACLPPNILGFVTRDGTVADLVGAIHAAGRGEVYCSSDAPQVYQRMAAEASARSNGDCIYDLTAREREILKLMQQGVSNKTISRQLGIGLSTVKNHVHSILAKLGVHRRGEAIRLLYRHEDSGRERDEASAPRSRRPAFDSEDDELPPQTATA